MEISDSVKLFFEEQVEGIELKKLIKSDWKGYEPAKGAPVLLGITKLVFKQVSFQQHFKKQQEFLGSTQRKRDKLIGLKENALLVD